MFDPTGITLATVCIGLLIIFVLFKILSSSVTSSNSTKKSNGLTSPTIPGPEPEDFLVGSGPAISSCGSLHEFLAESHATYGPIVKFWLGSKMCVSIASPELFAEQSDIFDRPYSIFETDVLIFTKDSIQIANGADARRRHAAYSKWFTPTAIKRYYGIYNKFSDELVSKWLTLPAGEHIHLQETFFNLAIKTFLLASFGEEFYDDKKCQRVHDSYNMLYAEVDRQFRRDFPKGDSDIRVRALTEHRDGLFKIIQAALETRRLRAPDEKDELLMDGALKLDLPESTLLADMITMFIGGFHTTALLLIWSIYYLSLNEEVQEKARTEVFQVVGRDNDVTPEMVEKLVYIQQILQETLRTAQIAPYAAREQQTETILGGYRIPAGTPVIQALGVAWHNSAIFSEPTRFDPDRFNPENELSRSLFSFEPFGFAGKRKCPGYRFSLVESTVLLAFLLRSFKLKLVPGQLVTKKFNLVSCPRDPLWLIIDPINV